MAHWLIHFFGADNGSGTPYLLWSGALGSFLIPNITTFSVFWVLFKKHNCHEHRCWRIGRHQVNGTPFVACWKHHPDVKKRTKISEHVSREAEKVSPAVSDAMKVVQAILNAPRPPKGRP